MSNNNQHPNWGNNPSGPQGSGQGQPGQGYGPQGSNPHAPQQGAPQQAMGPGPGQAPQNSGYPQQGYQPQQPQGWTPQDGSQQMAPAKKKSKAPAIIAGALALALVTGGIVFAMNFLGGATPAAAEGIPSNALAVFETNLNPSVADKLAVKNMAEKFPAMADSVKDVDGDYKKAMYQALFADAEEAPDYSEVEPWLGDSLAVAILPSATPETTLTDPDVMLVIQVTDKAKAEAFMTKHGDGAQVTFMDDLMLVTQEGTPAPDAASIKDASLADSSEYTADMAKLGGSWLATGWVGNELFKQIVAQTSQEAGVDAQVPNTRAAMGLKIEDGSAVMRAVSWSDQDVSKGAATTFLGTLPSASLGALSFSLSDSAHTLLWEQMEPLLAQDPEFAAMLGIESGDDLKAILGSEMAIAVGIDEYDQPTFGLKVRTDDVAKHEAFLETLGAQLGEDALQSVTEGDVIVTTFGVPTNEFAAPAESIADNETASKLTKASGDPQAAMWVDVPAILALPMLGLDESDEMVQNLKPLSGVGMSSSFLDDDYAETFVRVGTK